MRLKHWNPGPALPGGGLQLEQEARRRKAHHRVHVDRQVWEQATRGGQNFSGLVSRLLEAYVRKTSAGDGTAGEKVSVDVTVDDALWTEASRLARAQGLSLSHVLRDQLQAHLRKSRKRRPS